jgi:hypothetical protein
MAAGPTDAQVYRAKRKLCIRAEYKAIVAGYLVMRCGAKRVNMFDGSFDNLIGSVWPRVLRASNGEACIMLDSDSVILRELINA